MVHFVIVPLPLFFVFHQCEKANGHWKAIERPHGCHGYAWLQLVSGMFGPMS